MNNLNNKVYCPECASDSVFMNNAGVLECEYCGSKLELKTTVKGQKNIEEDLTECARSLQKHLERLTDGTEKGHESFFYSLIYDFVQCTSNEEVIKHMTEFNDKTSNVSELDCTKIKLQREF